jgi:hypothetical protein
MGLFPVEILFWCPPPLVKGLRGDLKKIGDLTLRQKIQALDLTLSKINDWVRERLPVSLTTSMHPYKPGDAVWVKKMKCSTIKPHWRGPFIVVLSTPTTVEVALFPGSTTAE